MDLHRSVFLLNLIESVVFVALASSQMEVLTGEGKVNGSQEHVYVYAFAIE